MSSHKKKKGERYAKFMKMYSREQQKTVERIPIRDLPQKIICMRERCSCVIKNVPVDDNFIPFLLHSLNCICDFLLSFGDIVENGIWSIFKWPFHVVNL